MKKLIYYVASTLDGFIASTDGSFDAFLQDGDHFADLLDSFPEAVPTHLRDTLGVTAPNRRFDTVLMGRGTYEVGLQFGVTSPYSTLRQLLFSKSLSESPDPNVELVSSNGLERVKELKNEKSGLDIWLCGGGQLATALFSEIDELILKVNPVLLGAGIKLFAAAIEPQSLLELRSIKTYPNGFMLQHYLVSH